MSRLQTVTRIALFIMLVLAGCNVARGGWF